MPSRRTILGASAVAVASLAGCLGTTGQRLDMADIPYEFDGTTSRPASRKPIVSTADGTVVVRGGFHTGSSTCSRVALDELALDGSALMVEVVPDTVTLSPSSCTDDISSTGYRLEVAIDPATVTHLPVTEAPVDDPGPRAYHLDIDTV